MASGAVTGDLAVAAGGCGADCCRATGFEAGVDCLEFGPDWPETRAAEKTVTQPATSSLVFTDPPVLIVADR